SDITKKSCSFDKDFSLLKLSWRELQFSVSKTQDVEDGLIELEPPKGSSGRNRFIDKTTFKQRLKLVYMYVHFEEIYIFFILCAGTEAFDKMQVELVIAKESLTKIFTSKDSNPSLLTLLGENTASAHQGNQ
ncbi:hypothetical protein RJ641_035394, partial [Dillenia turbinata]